jgi:hypothetical protein
MRGTDPLADWANTGTIADSRAYDQAASIVQIESSKLVPWLLLCCLVCGVGIGLGTFAMVSAQRTERETRLLEYYVMELDGKLMQAGIINFKDSYSVKKQEERK